MHIFNLTSFLLKCLCYLRALDCESVVTESEALRVFRVDASNEAYNSSKAVVQFFFPFILGTPVHTLVCSALFRFSILNIGFFVDSYLFLSVILFVHCHCTVYNFAAAF